MGIKLHARHKITRHKINKYENCSCNINSPAPNPDPSRWKLLEQKIFTNGYVLKVRYLDCTNFEGVKIIVFHGKMSLPKILDPHFSEGKNSPIARFRPDKKGWGMAIKLAKSL